MTCYYYIAALEICNFQRIGGKLHYASPKATQTNFSFASGISDQFIFFGSFYKYSLVITLYEAGISRKLGGRS